MIALLKLFVERGGRPPKPKDLERIVQQNPKLAAALDRLAPDFGPGRSPFPR
jgi:hypothetical protein